MDEIGEMSNIAAQLADRSRMAIALYLMDGESRTSTELAFATNISAPSASMHLAKLVQAGILRMKQDGRNKYYCIANPAVAHAIEAISAVVNSPQPANGQRRMQLANPWAAARTCYDHLAGRLGVELAAALQKQDLVRPEPGGSYVVTSSGADWMRRIGIDFEMLAHQRREFAKQCLDWTEQRFHIGGALGAALYTQMRALGWIAKSRIPRLVRLTHKGEIELARKLSLAPRR